MKRMAKVRQKPTTVTQSPSSPVAPKFGLLDFLQSPDQSFPAAENEPFHLSLDFLSFHAWLGQAVLGAMAEFADKKFARDRRMQTGQAWRAFEELFGGLTVLELVTLYSNLLCFAASDHPDAFVFLQAAGRRQRSVPGSGTACPTNSISLASATRAPRRPPEGVRKPTEGNGRYRKPTEGCQKTKRSTLLGQFEPPRFWPSSCFFIPSCVSSFDEPVTELVIWPS